MFFQLVLCNIVPRTARDVIRCYLTYGRISFNGTVILDWLPRHVIRSGMSLLGCLSLQGAEIIVSLTEREGRPACLENDVFADVLFPVHPVLFLDVLVSLCIKPFDQRDGYSYRRRTSAARVPAKQINCATMSLNRALPQRLLPN